MDIYNYLIDIFFNKLSGSLYGFLSVVIAFFFCLIALLSTPQYILFEHMVSELGVGSGSTYFNSGLILSGIIAVPFFISLGKSLNYKGVNENLRKSAIISSIISCISMSLIGCFPALQSNNLIFLLHGISTFICWFSGFIFVTIFSILFFKTSKFPKFNAYFGLLVAVIFMIVLCTWWPITEYAIIVAISIWVIINASYML